MKKILLILFIAINLFWIGSQNSYTRNLVQAFHSNPPASPSPVIENPMFAPSPSPLSQPKIQLKQPELWAKLKDQKYVYQTYNNCGPATLAMVLDFYGIQATQQEIADQLRPYNNPQGYNDDKAVTLDELALFAQSKQLVSFRRPNGDLTKLKLFLANGIPVITITWIEEKGGFGHYRIIKGFDEGKKQIIQDDSIFGQDQQIAYEEFMRLWQVFNYDYLVIVPTDKVEIVKTILAEEVDTHKSHQNAIKRSETEPQNLYSSLNRAVSFYYLGDYGKSVQNFEGIQSKIPPRLLWYQIQPIQSYQKLKIYDQVFSLTDFIFRSGNPAASELYQIRGESLLEQGKKDEAETEFAKAVFYKQPPR